MAPTTNEAGTFEPKFENALYDFQVATPPRTFYLIASTPRAGGTYFSQTLWRTGIMGAPHEYFGFYGTFLKLVARFKPETLQSFVENLFPRRTSANGVFGVKVHYDHLQFMILSGVLSQMKNAKVIYLEREDHLAQAVSQARALQTGQWTSLHDSPKAAPVYDAKLIQWCHDHLKVQRLGWQTFFDQNKLSPFRVDYDAFVASPQNIASEAIAHIGAPAAPVSPTSLPNITKQSDGLNVEWATRFKAEFEAAGGQSA